MTPETAHCATNYGFMVSPAFPGRVRYLLLCFFQRRNATIHKRTVLGQLPPNLVMHLTRFQMNLDTFQTEKVNTRFGFPQRLDLEPFTKEVCSVGK